MSAVALELELGDLRRHTPRAPAESSRPCLRLAERGAHAARRACAGLPRTRQDLPQRRETGLAARDEFPKGVHECRPFVGAVGREVDRSPKTRTGNFYRLRFRSGDVGEVFDCVDLCDGGVVNLSDEGLVEETTSLLAREKREDC